MEAQRNNPQSVACPNCGKVHDLTETKQKGWALLDELQAIVTTITPLLLGLGALCFLKVIAKHMHFAPSVGVMCSTFILTAACTFPLMLWTMITYQKRQLQRMSIRLYHVSCNCRPENTFTIVRHIIPEASKNDHPGADALVEEPHEMVNDL